MLDIKFIRENPTLIRNAARKKHVDFDVEALLKLDDERRSKRTEVEAMRMEMNTASDAIGRIHSEGEKAKAISRTHELKEKLDAKEKDLKTVDEKFEALMFDVPNVPDPSVPEGSTDADNQETWRWGTEPSFTFEPKGHLALLKDLGLADFERGSKVAGFRGYFLTGDGALLSFALWQFAIEKLVEKGFLPVIAPALMRERNFVGTGWLPQGKEEIYHTQDDLYLAGTSEVPIMGMFQDEILSEKDLPKKIVAFSPCYRSEAGSYGKDTKGLYRLHEFAKVEQVVLSRADHAESVRFHEKITKNAEEVMQALGLYYRVVTNCGGDLGLGQVKKYDIEAWIPSQKKFGETHSSSYFHDFQTRRLNIRYRDSTGTVRFVHSLNSTAIATPRALISLLEQNQEADGSVRVPAVLEKYLGKSRIQRG